MKQVFVPIYLSSAIFKYVIGSLRKNSYSDGYQNSPIREVSVTSVF